MRRLRRGTGRQDSRGEQGEAIEALTVEGEPVAVLVNVGAVVTEPCEGFRRLGGVTGDGLGGLHVQRTESVAPVGSVIQSTLAPLTPKSAAERRQVVGPLGSPTYGPRLVRRSGWPRRALRPQSTVRRGGERDLATRSDAGPSGSSSSGGPRPAALAAIIMFSIAQPSPAKCSRSLASLIGIRRGGSEWI